MLPAQQCLTTRIIEPCQPLRLTPTYCQQAEGPYVSGCMEDSVLMTFESASIPLGRKLRRSRPLHLLLHPSNLQLPQSLLLAGSQPAGSSHLHACNNDSGTAQRSVNASMANASKTGVLASGFCSTAAWLHATNLSNTLYQEVALSQRPSTKLPLAHLCTFVM